MNRANLWRASLLMIALTAIACGQEYPYELEQEGTLASREDALSQNQVLILGRTVEGGLDSPEAVAAQTLGMKVTVATDEQWAAMTTADFGKYRGIILGDAGCASLEVVSAALANRHVWGPAVNGHIFIAGTAPVANGATLVTEKAVRFATQKSGFTGMYISLSCYYQDALPDTHVELLEPFGLFSVQGGGCHSSAHIVGTNQFLDVLTDEALSDWSCSVNSQFTSFPQANFAPWAIAMISSETSRGQGGVKEFTDGTFGAPYILARGTRLIGCGNGEQEVGEACDYGSESNGREGVECSATCQLNWCGNGVVDEGEDCDLGSANGGATCPKSCRLLPAPPPPPPSHRPPVALCKHVVLSAGPFCGEVSALIDDGSNDPDGDLVGCVQDVTSFGVGTTTATVTCTDQQGLTASCTGTVKVEDDLAPTITCPAASSFECGVGTAQLTPAEAQDNCGTPYVTHSMSGDEFSLGSARTVTWSANDGANEATCSTSITMVDTLPPSIALTDGPQQQLECGIGPTYSELGFVASDKCEGDLSHRVTVSGEVNVATVGTYSLAYTVADNAGHGTTVTRQVKVADTKAPVVALKGDSTVALECGVGQYTEAGVTATDLCTGDLSANVSISGAVNPAARGSYAVTYSVADAFGNAASAVRTVSVDDTLAPSIALVGAATLSVNRGSTFTDPGATATDSCSGNLTSAIVKTGSVNTSVVGTYTLRYTVQDGAGLSASVTRTVTVADTCNTTVNVKPTRKIWPPNHKYVSFTLADCAAVTTSTSCGGSNSTNPIDSLGTILSIYSDEPEDVGGKGDGSTVDDIVITGKSSFKLRAERQGAGNGRVYGVNFKVTDSAGNVKTATCKLAVPHDQGQGNNAIDNGPAAGYTVNAPSWLAGL